MLSYLLSDPIIFLVSVVALLVAITVHEFAHAFAADRLGDPTPRLQGRLTLNPLAHLDPIGTLMLLIVRFGWGKPVQFDPYNLKNPKKDAAIISLAGPASNLILATILAIIVRLAQSPFSPFILLSNLLTPLIFLNVALAVFNLIPIHPLDGGKILVGLLPTSDALKVNKLLDQYGTILLIALVFPLPTGSNLAYTITSPLINLILGILIPSVKTI
ncbi:site-2 protease family protein [Candidatus Woesebacteria bacterium]|nr:site-2 protease family protein [Candidatus Woesebacteria bacterium]QQG47413.1 MAG: site-2 protease family protein [Candidatus Woesebacteria bacterium]